MAACCSVDCRVAGAQHDRHSARAPPRGDVEPCKGSHAGPGTQEEAGPEHPEREEAVARDRRKRVVDASTGRVLADAKCALRALAPFLACVLSVFCKATRRRRREENNHGELLWSLLERSELLIPIQLMRRAPCPAGPGWALAFACWALGASVAVGLLCSPGTLLRPAGLRGEVALPTGCGARNAAAAAMSSAKTAADARSAKVRAGQSCAGAARVLPSS